MGKSRAPEPPGEEDTLPADEAGDAAANREPHLLDETLQSSIESGRSLAADKDRSSSDPSSDLDDLPAVDPRNYLFVGEVARGGMGRIVAARDRRIGRPVAVKELLVKSPAAAARFEREARITARLQHPAIVPLYEAGKWSDGEPFYAMKLVEGRSLDKVIADATTVSERLGLLRNVIAVADALAYAHGNNVIHRDLKPSNVLVGAYGETVVIDWGLAKDLDAAPLAEADAGDGEPSGDDITRPGTALGTPAYMSPEQARGERVDARADVYSLGAMLYHLLSGQVPYRDTQHTPDPVARVLAGPPVPIREKAVEAPTDLLTIVEKAMARDPGDRYATAEDLAEDLHRFQTGQLVVAHRYTLGALLRRWVARHRAAVAVATAAAVVLAAVGVVSVRRITKERDRAEDNRALADRQRVEAERRGAEALLESARAAFTRDDFLEARAKLRASMEIADSLAARALWADLAERELVWTRQLPGYVNDVTFSPDGETVAAVCGTSEIYLLDTRTAAFRIIRGSADSFQSVAYMRDGRRLVAGTAAGSVQIWTVEGALLSRREGHTGPVVSVDVSRDGRMFVSGSGDGTIRVWATGAEESLVTIEAANSIPPVRFAPDGQTVAIGSSLGLARLWRVPSGKPEARIEVPGGEVRALAFSPDGETLLAGTTSAGLHEVNLRTRAVVAQVGAPRTVGAVAINPSGSRLVAAGSGWVKVHGRSKSGEWSDPRALLNESAAGLVLDAAFAFDGDHLATVSSDGTVQLWNTAHQGSRRARHGHAGDVHDVAISPNGSLLASAGRDTVVGLWLTETGTWIRGLRWHDAEVARLAFSPDGRYLASADYDGMAFVWEVFARSPHRVLKIATGSVWGLAFSPDGHTLATGSFFGVRTWDVSSGGLRRTIDAEFSADVDFSPDGRHLASYADNGRASVFDAASGKTVRTFENAGAHWQGGLAYSPRGDKLAFPGTADTLRIADMKTGELSSIAVPSGHIFRVAFHPNGTTIGTAHDDGTASLVDLASGKTVKLTGHRGPVRSIRFSDDGKRAATAGHDDTVRVWDAATGRPFWRTTAAVPMADGAPRIRTHRGWHRPGSSEETRPPPGAQMQASLAETAQAVTTRDRALVCARTSDDQVAVWDLASGERVVRAVRPGLRWVEAMAQRCAYLHGDELELVGRDGVFEKVGAGVSAIAWRDQTLLVARGASVELLDEQGDRQGTHEASRGAAAVSRVGDWLALGFDDGIVQMIQVQSGDRTRLVSNAVAASPVVRMLPGPSGTLIVGHANGRICVWDVARRTLVDHRKIHGPASYLLHHERTLYAATELGDHLAWDLSVYENEYCDLLRLVRADIPVVWRDGHAALPEGYARSACRGAKPTQTN